MANSDITLVINSRGKNVISNEDIISWLGDDKTTREYFLTR